jgi:Na+/proline symporter
MLNPVFIILILIGYMALLLVAALWAEKKHEQGKSILNNGIVYSLTIALYCTAWTFYGNIGLAATNNFLFLAVYLGAVLSVILWWLIVRKFVRLKNEYNITSIADFLSVRYGRSHLVGAIAAMIGLFGTMPYIALQLKAVLVSFSVIIGGEKNLSPFFNTFIDLLIVAMIAIFVIIFGMRKLNLTERHPGIIMVIAIKAVVKLFALLTAGIFVTYFIFGGFGDIFTKLSQNSELMALQRSGTPTFSLWLTYLLLSVSAIIFLPRQFHITVVENSNEKHLRTAIWLLPLYLFLITLFVFPISIGGALLGYPIAQAEFYALYIFLGHNMPWLALLVFVGGFSAAVGMVMITSITISNMTTNYLILPLVERIKLLNFIRKHILALRRLTAIFIILLGYWFKVKLGSMYMLVKIGMISFAAALQFLPAVIGGIFWKKGSKAGAALGLMSGFFVWAYTSIFPAFIRSGYLSMDILDKGPFGIRFLNPEHIFGIQSLEPLAITVFLSMAVNGSLYVIGSLLFSQSEDEEKTAEIYAGILFKNPSEGFAKKKDAAAREEEYISLGEKEKIIISLFSLYVGVQEARTLADNCLKEAGLDGKKLISVLGLADLQVIFEKALSAYIGAYSAKNALIAANFITKDESVDLSRAYGDIIARLKLSPEQLAEKINYYEDKERVMKEQGEELEKLVKDKTAELRNKLDELEKFQKVTIDRELKMIELKNKIREMEIK